MNYENLWKILEEIIVELRKKGVTVPPEIVNDLKSAQTLIKVYTTDPTALEVVTKIEMYIEKVEANIIYLAGSDVGEEYADECLKRLYEARMKGKQDRTETPSRFVTGVPKGEHWIRIKIPDLIDEKELSRLLEKLFLSSKPQENGYILVHGREEDVKAFIKEVGKKIKK